MFEMNEKQPYEQMIADKLQRLPTPDANASWQQMKRLLDDEDKKTGGDKKRPGPGGWWRTALVAIAFMAGLWLYTENKKATGDDIATLSKQSVSANSDNSKITSDNNKTASTDNTTTLEKPIVTGTEKNKKAEDIASGPSAINSLSSSDKSTSLLPENKNPSTTKNKTPYDPASATGSGHANVEVINNSTVKKSFEKNNHTGKDGTNTVADASKGTHESKVLNPANNAAEKESSTVNSNEFTGLKNNSFKPNRLHTGKNSNDKNLDNDASASNTINGSESILAKQQTYLEQLNDWKLPLRYGIVSSPTLAGDTMKSAVNNTNSLLTKESRTLALKARRENELELLAKKDKGKLKLNLNGFFKPFSMRIDAEPWWAAGLSINYTVPLNHQGRYSYNVNGKSGLLSDYIPSPFVQFHLNDYVYLQTELNINTPQLTAPLLVYQNDAQVAGGSGMIQQKSIYIQKLYYFNWPLSLHYSPINNLFVSAGIQFSSFQSGLAQIQTKTYSTQGGGSNPVYTNNTIEKFKDDSIAAKLSPTEWRWQAGADYYWNRFSVGMRYSKSFKDLLNVDVAHTITSSRNSSMIFFVRYNLFEGRSKPAKENKNSLSRY